MLNKTVKFGDEGIDQDDWYVEKYEQLNAENTELSLSENSLDGKVQSVLASYENKKDSSLTYSLSLSEGKHFLSIELTSLNKKKSIEKIFTIEEDCKLSYVSLDISEITYGNSLNQISTIYHNKVNDFEVNTLEFQGSLIDLEDIFNENEGREGAVRKTGVVFEDGQLVPASIEITWNAAGEFSLRADYKGLYSLEGQGKQVSSTLFYLQITKPFNLRLEIITAEKYLNTTLQGIDQLVTFENIDDEFFYGFDSILEVTTNNDVNLDFLKNYFELTEVSSSTYRLTPTLKSSSDESAALADITLTEDQKYLVGSDYIQISHPKIKEYKKKIESMNLQTRAEVIQAVQDLVTDVIDYDYDMLDNDVTRVLHLDDFLDKGKGVCQHFALLSTTLLRALGIPARIIVGYLLSNDQAGAHAWIEAKITNDYWLPIEPQHKEDYNIWTLSYYPLGVMSDYEKGNPLAGDRTNVLRGFTSKYHFRKIK